MLNNKGFAVSTVLYTLLIAFLLFLGATLAMFSSSNSIISNANNDLINGTKFKAVQVKDANKTGKCVAVGTSKTDGDYYWYEMGNNILVKINSRYGVMYWPRDFNGTIEGDLIKSSSTHNNIKILYKKSSEPNYLERDTIEVDVKEQYDFKIVNVENNSEYTNIIIGDICG